MQPPASSLRPHHFHINTLQCIAVMQNDASKVQPPENDLLWSFESAPALIKATASFPTKTSANKKTTSRENCTLPLTTQFVIFSESQLSSESVTWLLGLNLLHDKIVRADSVTYLLHDKSKSWFCYMVKLLHDKIVRTESVIWWNFKIGKTVFLVKL